MFVITADQIGSRQGTDIVDDTLARITERYGDSLALPPDRTAGDELQVLTGDGRTALSLILHLTRTAEWSVGVGIGRVRMPLPAATRQATGDAFYAARDAVTRAKRSATRFALGAATADQETLDDDEMRAADAEALVTLVIMLRDRRTEGGWTVYDLLDAGLSQQDAAERLGITPGAASLRVRTAGIRAEEAASEALVRLLKTIDRSAREGGV